MEFLQKKQMLLEVFHCLPGDDYSVSRFRKAYFYRRQFEYLAEYGNDGDDRGLVSALSTALYLSIGFEIGNVYADSERGLEHIPAQFLSEVLPGNFKQDLCAAAHNLSEHTIKIFFESLDWAKLDYQNPEKLQWAVSESLHNYARIATVGTDFSPPEPPEVASSLPVKKKRKGWRKDQPNTLRSLDLMVVEDGKTNGDSGKSAVE